jgi:hypothetical protein
MAGWWMDYGALIDLGTLGVIFWLLRRDHSAYRDLLGPPTATSHPFLVHPSHPLVARCHRGDPQTAHGT